MYKFTEEQYTLLVDIMESIAIPPEHKLNIFWCPKVIEKGGKKREGVILYIYGGHALEIYANKSGLGASIFSKRYYQHFEVENKGQKLRQEFCDANKHKKGISVIKKWNEADWYDICVAFRKWATKPVNSEYERMRQTRICNDNMDNEELTVFTMEEKISIEDKKPEADMVAIHHKDGETFISYIEYKCTEAAILGACSIQKHYGDMAKISTSNENIDRMLKLYYQKQKMLGKQIKYVDINKCKQEIVFLISNVQVEKDAKEIKRGKEISANTLCNKLEETIKREDFRDSDVKVILLDSVNIKNNDKYVLHAEDMITMTEAIARFKANLK